VTATGQLSRPTTPSIPGIDRFAGKCFHSAQWDHDYDLEGKRVAVVGTGASAIQFLPEIAPRVKRLHLFQRSAPWLLRKPDRPYGGREQTLYRRAPWIQALSRVRVHLFYELLILMFTKLQWLQKPFERAYERRIRKEIPDPELRERLVPDYPLGCKRVLLSNDWLETLARPNVDVVTDPIAEIEADGIVTEDGEKREVDAIILATGFATTDFLAPMAVTGLEGRDLNEAWRDGAEAYLGLAVSGFPNMFMLYGPNTNLGAGSIIYMLESQIGYVVDAVRVLERAKLNYLDVRGEAQGGFNREIQERLSGSVWMAGCSSWYVTESGKVTNNWPGVTTEYRRRTRRVDLADYTVAAEA
jgi:cation diffusion facilitator CzcD-associated flavoprotein CzcO